MVLVRLLVIAALIGVWATTQPSVSACLCLSPWYSDDWVETVDWSRYEQIFRGVVVEEYPESKSYASYDDYPEYPEEWTVYEFDVSVVWKNVRDMYHDRIWVHQRWFTSCDMGFTLGEEYIVAVDFNEWSMSQCDVTTAIGRRYSSEGLPEMLSFLGEGTVVPDGSYKPRALEVTTPPHLEAKPPDDPLAPANTPQWQWVAIGLGISASFGAFIYWARREQE